MDCGLECEAGRRLDGNHQVFIVVVNGQGHKLRAQSRYLMATTLCLVPTQAAYTRPQFRPYKDRYVCLACLTAGIKPSETEGLPLRRLSDGESSIRRRRIYSD